MGVDLRLLPLLGPEAWVSHSMLDLERRRALWPAVEALSSQEIPEPLSCYLNRVPDGSYQGEPCYGYIEKDPYGNRLRWTTAKELLKLSNHESVQDNYLNRAVWAYLAQIPPDWKIVLYWH